MAEAAGSAALRFCDAGDEEQRQQELQTVAAAVKAGTLARQALVQQLDAAYAHTLGQA